MHIFSNIKTAFIFEDYISIIKNSKHRQIFAQIRISAHNLKIEVGRHQGVPRENRLCLSCNDNVIEDEAHFILHCNKHSTFRTELFDNIRAVFPDFQLLSEIGKLHFLLLSSELSPLIAKFLFNINNNRTH